MVRRTSRTANNPTNNGGERPVQRSRVRGPQSALTSFLQEIGVNANEIRINALRRQQELALAEESLQEQRQQPSETADSAADTSTADDVGPSNEQVEFSAAEPNGQSSAAVEGAAELLPGTSSSSASKKRKKPSKKSKKDSGSDSDDGDDDYDNEGLGNGLNRSSARKGGKIYNCDMCGTRFLVRQKIISRSERILCTPCTRSVEKAKVQSSGPPARRNGGARQPAARTRRKLKKTEDGLLELDTGLPSLQDLCIRKIGRHIHDISSFGDISEESLDKVCKIICKLRELTNDTVKLFLSRERTRVRLYDCTKLNTLGLRQIVDLSSPDMVTELRLNFCGQMRDIDLLYLGRMLPNLRRVELHGPFLVTDDSGFGEFFRLIGGRLKEFSISAARFGVGAMRALVENCGEGLEKLRLAECPNIGDDCLTLITGLDSESTPRKRGSSRKGKEAVGHNDSGEPVLPLLTNLRSLEIDGVGKKITTETLISALDAVGSGLTELTLAECPTLDDTILTDGILACCPRLTKLRLEGCPRISAEACATFLSLWREKRSEFNTNLRKDAASAQSSLFESAADSSSSLLSGPPPTLPYWPDGLQLLSFKRCTAFSDDVLIQLVLHSGPTLTSLDLHSVSDNLTERGLLALAGIHLSVPISDDTLIEELLDQGQEVGEDDQHIIDAYRKKREAEEQRRAESVFLPGCPKLEYLNLSFVRAITDDILYKIIKVAPGLRVIEVWGCARVTALAPKRPGLTYIGRECDTL